MIVEFFDRQNAANPLNGSKADGAAQLLRILDAHQDRVPFFAELVGANGFNLLVGLGGSVGCVQYSSSSGELPYLMAVNPDPQGQCAATFLIGDTATPVQAQFCMPFETVRAIVGHFANTGERSATVVWAEV